MASGQTRQSRRCAAISHILEDNETPAARRHEAAAEAAHGVAQSIRIIRLPGLDVGGDVWDWLDAGNDQGRLIDFAGTVPEWAPPESEQPAALIISSRDFIENFTPPDYIVDGLLQQGFLWSLTGATGAGKTCITLRLAASVATGAKFANRETKKMRVLYLAAENPDDVRMRWIALAQHMHFDPRTIDVFFIEGAFKISGAVARLKDEADAIGGEFGMVIIDTSPVFFEGDDENNRTQARQHALMLRTLIDTIPGRPAVVANCHPVKNAAADNLLPAGGGSFLNEVDGNLTAAKTDSTSELHWQGKFRGVEFAPMHFTLKTVTHERLKDSRGRLMPTVICEWISDTAQEEIRALKTVDEDRLLALIAANPKASLRELAIKMEWTLHGGDPKKVKVGRWRQGARARQAGQGNPHRELSANAGGRKGERGAVRNVTDFKPLGVGKTTKPMLRQMSVFAADRNSIVTVTETTVTVLRF